MARQKFIEPVFGAKKRLWTDAQIRKVADRIDRYNGQAEALVRAIRDSHHLQGESIADELDAQCVVLISAYAVVDGLLNAASRTEERTR